MKLAPGSVTQFAYVTRDLQRSIQYWMKTMKAGPFFIMHTPLGLHMQYRGQQGADTITAGVAFCGMTNIEIVQPTNDAPSIFQEILKTKGEGLHHIQPHMGPLSPVEYQRMYDGYLSEGLELASYLDVPGTGRTAFFDDVKRNGNFIELIEFAGGTFDIIQRMYDAHLEWDGNTRARTYEELFI